MRVETRLTAEQFYKTWPVSIFNESDPLACMFELMEAFRDKSESHTRDMYHKAKKDELIALRQLAGLREEIERLKRERS